MLNSDILGYIFLKIDDAQTTANFACCSKEFSRISQQFSDLKRSQFTKITVIEQIPGNPYVIFITTDFPNGWSETRDKLGQLFTCGQKRNGKKHGIWKRWDAYGNLIEQVYCVNGIEDGYRQTWFTTDDGQQGPSIMGKVKNGTPHGLHISPCFPLYFAWFINGRHEWFLVGLFKSCISTLKSWISHFP